MSAQQTGPRSPGAAHAAVAARAAQAWYGEHERVDNDNDNDNDDYLGAVQLAINESTQAVEKVDTALRAGLSADQTAFAQQAEKSDRALGGLAASMAIAALLMAVCCSWGVSRRIAEYR